MDEEDIRQQKYKEKTMKEVVMADCLQREDFVHIRYLKEHHNSYDSASLENEIKMFWEQMAYYHREFFSNLRIPAYVLNDLDELKKIIMEKKSAENSLDKF